MSILAFCWFLLAWIQLLYVSCHNMPSVFGLVNTTITYFSNIQRRLYVKKENRRSEGSHFCHQINRLQLSVPCLMFCTLTYRHACAPSVTRTAVILWDMETKETTHFVYDAVNILRMCSASSGQKNSTGYIFLYVCKHIVYITIFYFKKIATFNGANMFLHECGFLYFQLLALWKILMVSLYSDNQRFK